MGRVPKEFKNLGRLPKGEWTVVLAVTSGSLMLACADHEPMVISNGKLQTLTEQMGGKPNGKEEATVV